MWPGAPFPAGARGDPLDRPQAVWYAGVQEMPLVGGNAAEIDADKRTRSSSSTATARQAGRFGLVGVLNTTLDFVLFSALRLAALPLVAANVVSTSACMVLSFFLNRRFVFAKRDGSWKRQGALFLAGTAFSMYVLQNLVMVLMFRGLPSVLELAVGVGKALGIQSEAGALLIRSNTAKGAATVASLVWNFCFYRWVVFAAAPVVPDA